ncbi:MAG: dienelactone hydrolase family protein [Gemmataceae bacterium]
MRPLSALFALTLTASLAAADVKTETIKYPSGDDTIQGYLAVPEGEGPFPAIVVIQEWWGLNDWIKENARRLAAQGYVCLAVDLYRGKVATEMTAARKLMMGLPADRAMRDLKAAVDVLAKHDKVRKDRIGSIGWCMGGAYSLQLALADKRVVACTMCYGRVVTDPAKLAPLNAKVLGVFGKEDKGIPITEVRKFGEALKTAGKQVEAINEYEAGHGFMREKNGPRENPEYRASEAKAAWAAIDKFFASTLKGK